MSRVTKIEKELIARLDNLRKFKLKTDGKDVDYYKVHYKRFKKILTCIEFKPEHKILDIGSSPGYIAKALKDYGCDVHAIDFYLPPLFKDIPSHVMNVEKEKLPFKDNTFDVVLFCDIIEHLIFDPWFVMEEINRVLKPEGNLVLNVPNACAFSIHISILLGRNIQGDYHVYYKPAYHKGDIRGTYSRHTFVYTMKQISELLKETKFDVIKKGYFHRNFFGDRDQIIVIAKKNTKNSLIHKK
jgi:2-polyprenyl-3-methyl-5-hydroxy-6-metoxy-1,4-benzoquinol methylase